MKQKIRILSLLMMLILLLSAGSPVYAEKIIIDTETATEEEILAAISKLEDALPDHNFMSSSSAPADSGKRGLPMDGDDPMTSINVSGINIKCYYADLTQFDPEEVADIPDSLMSMTESSSPIIRLKGDIEDCYGIGFYFEGQAGRGEPFSSPWCGVLHLSNNSWSRGQGDRNFPYNSGKKYAEVLLSSPSGFNEIQFFPIHKIKNWMAAVSFTPARLFFKSETARDRYLDSLQ